MKYLSTIAALFLFSGLSFGQVQKPVQSNSRKPIIERVISKQTITPENVYERIKTSPEILAKYRALLTDNEEYSSSPRRGTKFMTEDAVQPVTPPFTCKFETSEDMEQHWTVINANDDGNLKKWRWSEHSETYPSPVGKSTGGYAKVFTTSEKGTDDWLITRNPIVLPAGPAHIAFFYQATYSEHPEHMKVYYGTSSDYTQMTLLCDLEDFTEIDWTFYVKEFDIEQAGNYYFAFYACSEPSRSRVAVTNVTIDTGHFVGTPDLMIDYVELPFSACGLSTAEPIGINITNKYGTADITQFSLTYTIDDNEPVTELFTEKIPVGGTKMIYFTQKGDFSTEGATYKVKATGKIVPREGEKDEDPETMDNNDGEASITHYFPLPLPFYSDMREEEGRNCWSSQGNAWIYDEDNEAMSEKKAEALVSRCVILESDKKYRITYDLKAGWYFGMLGVTLTDSYDVLVGEVGTPMSEWQTVASRKDVYTEEIFMKDEIEFTCPKEGVYNIAIVPAEKGFLHIRTLHLTDIKAHDVRILAYSGTLGRLTPAHLASQPSFEVSVQNHGLNEEAGAKVELKNGEATIATSKTARVNTGDKYQFSVTGTMATPKAGSTVNLDLVASMMNTDEQPEDNKLTFTFEATDSEFAFDNVPDQPANGIGTSQYIFGKVFTIPVPATIRGVKLGWLDRTEQFTEALTVGLEIYPVNDDGSLGQAVLTKEISRAPEGGFKTYTFEEQELSAGSWFIALRQMDENNIAIGDDSDISGYFQAYDGKKLVPITGYGYIAVRGIFGQSTGIDAHEAEADRITSYPGIVSDIWTLEARQTNILRVDIINQVGTLLQCSAENLPGTTLRLNVKDFTPGLYLAKVYTDAGIQVIRFIVKK